MPKSCKFLGVITNANVHEGIALQSTVEDLQKDDTNFLKNEGAKLGANTIVFESHNATQKPLKFAKNPTYYTMDVHSISAKGYLCPPAVLNQLKNDFKIHEAPLIY